MRSSRRSGPFGRRIHKVVTPHITSICVPLHGGSDCESLLESRGGFEVYAPPKCMNVEELNWFTQKPKSIYSINPGLVEIAANRIETGIAKFYCAGSIFDGSGFYHQPGFLSSRLENNNGSLVFERPDAARFIPGEFIGVSDQSSTRNIYHWLIEVIPALVALRAHRIGAPVIITVDGKLTSWQVETLEILQEKNFLAIDFREQPVCIERLSWRRNRELPYLTFNDLTLARERLSSGHKAGKRRRLFLKRAFHLPRSLANEEAAELVLLAYGFEIVSAENLTFTEQRKLFCDAEIIVGAHGAGLANILFAASGTTVIELLPSDEIRTYFWLLSEKLRLRYHFLRCLGSMHGRLTVDTSALGMLLSAVVPSLLSPRVSLVCPPPMEKHAVQAFASSFQQPQYSQFGEDAVLDWIFAGKSGGSYVDVGCHHPYRFSNTARLHSRDWTGLNIDADERSIQLFETYRPGDVNVCIGISDKSGEMEMAFFDDGAVNTFANEAAIDPVFSQHPHTRRLVKVAPLGEVLKRYWPEGRVVDFLNVDAEGLDDVVLGSNDWNICHPYCIAVEDHRFDFRKLQESKTYQMLSAKGYRLMSHLAVTSIYALIP